MDLHLSCLLVATPQQVPHPTLEAGEGKQLHSIVRKPHLCTSALLTVTYSRQMLQHQEITLQLGSAQAHLEWDSARNQTPDPVVKEMHESQLTLIPNQNEQTLDVERCALSHRNISLSL